MRTRPAVPGRRLGPWGGVSAKASGTVEYDGETIEILAGVTHIAAGHPILRIAPHLFGLGGVLSDREGRGGNGHPATFSGVLGSRGGRI